MSQSSRSDINQSINQSINSETELRCDPTGTLVGTSLVKWCGNTTLQWFEVQETHSTASNSALTNSNTAQQINITVQNNTYYCHDDDDDDDYYYYYYYYYYY